MHKMPALIVMLFVPLAAAGETDTANRHPLCTDIAAAIGGNPAQTKMNIDAEYVQTENRIEYPHDAVSADKEIHLRYGNGFVVFNYVGKQDRYVLQGVQLSRTDFGQTFEAVLPEQLADLIELHGNPQERTATHIRYYCSADSVEWLDIFHDAGITTGFKFTTYIEK